MKKYILLLGLIIGMTVCAFSQTAESNSSPADPAVIPAVVPAAIPQVIPADSSRITIEVTDVVINGGKVFLAIFQRADQYKVEIPEYGFVLEDDKTAATQEIVLQHGDYVISAFQDANDNKKLDYRIFGIPKELVAMSNYFGKGFPSRSFDRQKIPIDGTTEKVSIKFYKF